MPKVLIAEDSFVIRKIIRKILEEVGFKIVAEVDNGLDAVAKTRVCKPDLIVMDVVMPKMDGLTALDQIMTTCPTKILLISAYGPKYANIAFEAIERGAIAFISKPSGDQSLDYNFKEELQTKAKACLEAKLGGYTQRSTAIYTSRKKRKKPIIQSQQLVIIGASTGGPKVVQELLSNLRTSFPPVIVIQHLPAGFSSTFATRLDKMSKLKVIEAQTGMNLNLNTVYVAPGGTHLVFEEKNNRLEVYLYKGERVNGVIPSLEPTIVSATYHYGKNVTLVVLTGMGTDGLAGARYSKNYGATILAQDEASSTIYGMPKAIVDAGLADIVANPKDIAAYLNVHFAKKPANI
ncbi:MAG: chemotaxis-specific protein-glutamate methyltransferase CheB [Promethearchaeota archaeon]